MGKFTPKPYRVFRDGEWVWVHPKPQEYVQDDRLKSIQITKNGVFKPYKKRKK
jgi:hypothetical protein